MNKKELLKIIKNDIIEHFDGYSQKNDLLIKQPINSLLKGISFDISSFGQVSCTIFIQPLFVPFEAYSYLYSFTIRDNNNKQWWDIPQNINELIFKIKQTENKVTNNLDDINNFFIYFSNLKTGGIRFIEGLVYTACFTLREDYQKDLIHFIDLFEKSNSNFPWEIECITKAKLLLELANKSEQLMIQQLNEWKTYTLKYLKINL